MTTTTVFGDAADGYIESSHATYATAANGGGTFTVDDASSGLAIGQRSGYNVDQSFVAFDTSTVPDTDAVSASVLSFCGSSDSSSADFDMNVYVYDWGASVTSADWRTIAQLAAMSRVAFLNSSAYSAIAYMNFTEVSGLLSASINTTGMTRLMLASAQQASGTAPVASAWLNLVSANLGGTSFDPKLVLTHDVAPSKAFVV